MALRNWYRSFFGKRHSKARTQSPATRNRRTSLRLEPLEERRLLAVTLSVTKMAQDSVAIGGQIDYSISVFNVPNEGNTAMEAAKNVVVSDVLDAGLGPDVVNTGMEFVSMTAVLDNGDGTTTTINGAYNSTTHTASIALGDVEFAAGVSISLLVNVTSNPQDGGITPPPPTDVILNTATATADNVATVQSETVATYIVVGEADAGITAYGPSQLYPGEDMVWTYTVYNSPDSPIAADDRMSVSISIDDNLGRPDRFSIPTGYTYEYVTPELSNMEFFVLTPDSGVTLAPGASFDIKFYFDNVNLPDVDMVGSYAQVNVWGDPNEMNDYTDTSTQMNVTTSTADLKAELTGPYTVDGGVAVPSNVTAGETIDYTLKLTNDGPANAEQIVVTDTLPTGTSWGSAVLVADGYTLTPSGDTYTIAMNSGGSLAAGDSVTFVVQLNIAASFTDSILPESVSYNWSDATAAQETPLWSNPVITEADLTADIVAVNGGGTEISTLHRNTTENYTYNVSLKNNGPSDSAAPVTFVVQLPALGDDLTIGTITSDDADLASHWFITVDSGLKTVTFLALTSVAADYAAVFHLPVTVDTTNWAGETLAATVNIIDVTTTDPVANAQETWNVDVPPPSNLQVSKLALSAADRQTELTSVVAGSDLLYKITLTNAGTVDATDVVVTDTLAPGVSFDGTIETPTDWTVTTGGNIATGLTVTFSKSLVAAGDTPIVFWVPVSVAADLDATSITNQVDATCTSEVASSNDTATASTDVQFQSDLGVSQVYSNEAAPGATLTYEIHVTNDGPSVARDVALDETLTGDFTSAVLAQTSGPAFQINLDEIDATGGTLLPGEEAIFTLTVVVSGSASGVADIVNRADVASSSTETGSDPNTAIATTDVLVANLGLTKTTLDENGENEISSVVAGKEMIYQINLTNTGPDAAKSVVITDTLPAGVSLAPDAPTTIAGFTVSVAGQTVTLTATGNIPVGADIDIDLPVVVDPSATGTIAGNTATVTTATTDLSMSDHSDTTDPLTVVVQSDLQVTQSFSAKANPNDLLVYTITVTNSGPSVATSVTLDETLTGDVTLVNFGQLTGPLFTTISGIDASGGTLAPGQSATFELRAGIDGDADGVDDVVNVANVTSDSSDPNGDNNTFTATTDVTVADLSLTKAAYDEAGQNVIDTIVAGTEMIYRLTLSNDGPDAATNVQITDWLPDGASLAPDCPTTINGFAVSVVGQTVTLTAASVGLGTVQIDLPILVASSVVGSIGVNHAAVTNCDVSDPDSIDRDAIIGALTVTTSADVSVLKSASTSVVAGHQLIYTITVANSGPSDALNVTLTDTLPGDVVFDSQSQVASDGRLFTLTNTGNAISNSISSLAPGATVTFTVVTTVEGDTVNGTVIHNVAAVTTDTTDPDTDDHSTSVDTTVSAVSDLRVTQSVNKSSANRGEELIYTITVTNDGPQAAANVLVDNALSSNVTLQSMVQQGATTFTIVGEDATAGTLGIGESATFILTVKVNDDADGVADALNKVTVSSNSADLDPTDDSFQVATNVTVADLALTKAALDDDGSTPITSVVAGEHMIYRIHLTNGGPDPAKSVVITDTLPAGASLLPTTISDFTVSVTGQTVTLTATSDIASGADLQIDLPILVASSAAGSIAANTAAVVSSTSDPDSADLSATTDALTVTTSADVTVTKVAASSSVVAGSDVVYTIRVTNNGPSDAAGVIVVDTLPASYVTNPLATVPTGYTADTTSVAGQVTIKANSGTTVAAGSFVEFTIRVSTDANVQEDHTLTNNVSVEASDDSTPNNNTGTSVVTLLGGRADLSVTKKSAPVTIVAGQTVTYTFTITNGGPTEARNVVLTDPIPSGMTYVTATASGYTVSVASGKVTLTRNSALAPQASDTVTIVLATSAGAANGSIIGNTVTVSSTTSDPVSSNNSVTAATRVTDLGVGLSTSPLDPTKTDLVIGGRTTGADTVYVYRTTGGVMVTVNGKYYGVFNPNGRIVAYGRGGNDVLYVASTVPTSAWLYGGDGNDVMYGGGGNDVLLGGNGTDVMWGYGGRNLLIGGSGTDTLYGNTGENIMIGGTTAHDANDAALNAIMKEWTRTDVAQTKRIYHLRGDNPSIYGTGLNAPYFLNSSTVYDDAARDLLVGGSRLNWYFQSMKGSYSKWDQLSGRWATETVNYLY